MSIPGFIQYWNVTPAERDDHYTCERFLRGPADVYLRGVGIDVPPRVAFRWVCQFKVAPYSYDWIDHWGKQSPRSLTPGADDLALGQRILDARIVDFAFGRELTCISTPSADLLFGEHVLTYRVSDDGNGGARVVGALAVPAVGRQRFRAALLGAGDLVMMRKQLLTLKRLAESHHREPSVLVA